MFAYNVSVKTNFKAPPINSAQTLQLANNNN